MRKLLYVLFAFVVLLSSCRKDDDSDSSAGSGQNSGTTITSDFIGTVTDLQGNPLSGVAVSVGGVTAVTNSSGMYRIANATVNKTRAVLSAAKAGFWTQQSGVIARTSVEKRVDFMLFPDSKAFTVNGTSGGVVSLSGGTTITFPANAFVTASGAPYTGTVTLTAHEIGTSDNNFTKKVPGRDLYALNAAGDDGVLISYGMAGAKLYDGVGNELKLASGKTATVRFPIASTQLSNAPATIALWHYDETKMYWVEEGSATRNGNYYEGSVAHFSWWNCDYFSNVAYLTVNVTGCGGSPVAFEEVELYNSTVGYASDYTDQNGNVYGMVPANVPLQITLYNLNMGTMDTTFTIGPFTSNSSNNVNVSLSSAANCNRIDVILRDCNNVPVNGGVVVTCNGVFLNAGTTSNLFYSQIGSQNGTYLIAGTSGALTGSTTVTVNSSTVFPLIINLNLCDTIATTAGNISINFNSPLLGSQSVNLQCTGARYYTINGFKQIHFTYIDSITGDSGIVKIHTPGYAPGNYAWNTFDSFVDGTIIWQGNSLALSSGTGSTTFTNAPPVGSNFQGSFAGTMYFNNLTTVPVQVNATFDVVRLQ